MALWRDRWRAVVLVMAGMRIPDCIALVLSLGALGSDYLDVMSIASDYPNSPVAEEVKVSLTQLVIYILVAMVRGKMSKPGSNVYAMCIWTSMAFSYLGRSFDNALRLLSTLALSMTRWKFLALTHSRMPLLSEMMEEEEPEKAELENKLVKTRKERLSQSFPEQINRAGTCPAPPAPHPTQLPAASAAPQLRSSMPPPD
ncbi:hypothetical protein SELMODRAFT_445346 [Selaginella moellendorffii]|uniref:Uncharacterized protein n=1 Tax=Selaginella moellendorffii TaxID=88036 RepID=D8SHW8_SELML|nr:hypothetical protein SELMODRAFT_445346 [Selaginella moellendorffii]